MGSLDPRHAGARHHRRTAGRPQGHAGDHAARVAELLEAVGLPRRARPTATRTSSPAASASASPSPAPSRPGPRILVADEPVSALDVSVRAQVLNLITDLVDELDLTLVFVSHDLSVVRHVCDRVAVMHDGQIVETGTTDEVYENPQHPYTQRLVAAVPTLAKALAGVSAADLAAATLSGKDRP